MAPKSCLCLMTLPTAWLTAREACCLYHSWPPSTCNNIQHIEESVQTCTAWLTYHRLCTSLWIFKIFHLQIYLNMCIEAKIHVYTCPQVWQIHCIWGGQRYCVSNIVWKVPEEKSNSFGTGLEGSNTNYLRVHPWWVGKTSNDDSSAIVVSKIQAFTHLKV